MGIFVTIEGPNGVGKSTFIQKLAETLAERFEVVITKEPSESNFGDYVKNNEELGGTPYAYLISADRCYHLENFVEPELKNGKVVISDRYIESSLVLQTYDGVGIEDVWRLNCKFRTPDLSIILLCSEEKLRDRLVQRDKLTHFEKKMTRREEIEGYIKAEEFIRNKGFNTIVFRNDTEYDLDKNIFKCVEIICDIERNK